MENKGIEKNTIIGAVLMIAAIVALVLTDHLNILFAILAIGIVICFHEFGHFLFARINGVTVKEFSLGMGPRLFSKKIRGTRWSIKLLPFGGSCIMLGEDEPTPVDIPEEDESDAENKARETASDASEGTFRSKGVWQRISIIFAGPFFNFILAFLLACIILGSIGYDPALVIDVTEETAELTGLQEGDLITGYEGHTVRIGRDIAIYETLDGVPEKVRLTYERDGKKHEAEYETKLTDRYLCGISYTMNREDEHLPMVLMEVSGAALEAGMKAGDTIIGVRDTSISTPEDFRDYTQEHPITAEPVSFRVLRDGVEMSFTLTPVHTTERSLGFSYNTVYREKVGVFSVIRYGAVEVRYWIKATVKSLKYLIQGKAKRQDVGGAVRVVSEMSDVVDESYRTDGMFYAFLNLINWMILLSANLGVMNLLPIPALDGGRLLFLLIEAVRGKPVNPKVEGVVTMIGFILLMALMVFILFNDISNVFGILLPFAG